MTWGWDLSHQSYEFSGGVWILREGFVFVRFEHLIMINTFSQNLSLPIPTKSPILVSHFPTNPPSPFQKTPIRFVHTSGRV